MVYRTLISADELMSLQRRAVPVVLLDCSFDLVDTAKGERSYRAGHVRGAHYLHLDRDLAAPHGGPGSPGPREPGFPGRHPLPERAAWAARVAQLGIGPGVQAVCLDGEGGPYAARAWWLLRWLGHEAAAVLDGGVAAWRAAGGAFDADPPAALPARPAYPTDSGSEGGTMPVVEVQALTASRSAWQLVDARAPERFRGDTEPLDPVGGHIPGARNRFFKDNLQPDGRFKPAAQLRAEFEALGLPPGTPVVHQCGSGVTACHNLLAMAHAGLGETALYPGSWSQWCADPGRPVARGA